MEQSSTESQDPTTNIYLKMFMPMVLSMTFNQPNKFWTMTYNEEMDKFYSYDTEDEQLNSLFMWFGTEPLVVAVQVIKNLGLMPSSPIVDIGTGNGHFCELLHSIGFTNLTGTDFCEAAIILAKHVRALNKTKRSSQEDPINYVVDDVLASKLSDNSFDFVFDKGTLDSITMVSRKLVSDGPQMDLDVIRHQYRTTIDRILRKDKYLLITSCNHDREELTELFSKDGGYVMLQDMTDLFDGDLRMMLFQKQK